MCNELYRPAFVIKTNPESPKSFPTIEVGLFGDLPHCYAKFIITWRLQGGVLRPYLLVDQLDWRILDKLRGVFGRMSRLYDQKITPDRFAVILAAAGFVDLTDYGSVDDYFD